ncbi:uncharacterized protein LOC119719453 [Patiria miniata]|uniref:Uncharacterized protein n=1 Tax=Patiria miniata TaxID=46514 RepID=A0A913Z1G7_PATMI|nr:uncharacterized protein LOC119719453 [Patiria miniata]
MIICRLTTLSVGQLHSVILTRTTSQQPQGFATLMHREVSTKSPVYAPEHPRGGAMMSLPVRVAPPGTSEENTELFRLNLLVFLKLGTWEVLTDDTRCQEICSKLPTRAESWQQLGSDRSGIDTTAKDVNTALKIGLHTSTERRVVTTPHG